MVSIVELTGLEIFNNVLGASKLEKKTTRDGPRFEKVAILEDKHLFNLLTSCKEARLRLTGRTSPAGDFAGCAVDGFWRKKYLGLVEGDFSNGYITAHTKASLLGQDSWKKKPLNNPLPEVWKEPREQVIMNVGYFQAYKCFSSWTCQFCGTIEGAANPTTFVRVCQTCAKGVCPEQKVISKSKAKEVYMLNDSDLAPLPSALLPGIGPSGKASSSGAQPKMEIFSIVPVAERAKEKFGGEAGFKAEVEKRIATSLMQYESKKASGKRVKEPKTATRCTCPWDFDGESGACYMVLPVGFKTTPTQLEDELAKTCSCCIKNGTEGDGREFEDGHVCSMYKSMQGCWRCKACAQTGSAETIAYHYHLEHGAEILATGEGVPRELSAFDLSKSYSTFSQEARCNIAAEQFAELESILRQALKNYMSKKSTIDNSGCEFGTGLAFEEIIVTTITSFAIISASGEEIKFSSYLEDICSSDEIHTERQFTSRWQMVASGPSPACIPIVLLMLWGGEREGREVKAVDDNQMKALADRIGLKHATPCDLLAFLMDLSCDVDSVLESGVVDASLMFYESPVGFSHHTLFDACLAVGYIHP